MMEPDVWYKPTGNNVMNGLVSSRNGLSSHEAARRLSVCGLNVLNRKKTYPPARQTLSHFQVEIGIILFCASLIFAFRGLHGLANMLFVIACADLVLLYVRYLYSVFADNKGEKKHRVLKSMVYRDGVVGGVPSQHIVPGDIIEVNKGDRITVDARIIEENFLACNEIELTGKGGYVRKSPGVLSGNNLPLERRSNMVFMGSTVTDGAGLVVAVATASNTEIGRKFIIDKERQKPSLQFLFISLSVIKASFFIAVLLIAAQTILAG